MFLVKNLMFLAGLFFLFVPAGLAQTAADSPIRKKDPLRLPEATDKFSLKRISEPDWREMEDALLADNWSKAARLSGQYLEQLKAETSDKQIARLRYIRLFALAGRVIGYNFAENPAAAERARAELKKEVGEMTGRRFMFPARRILAECRDVVNYICRSEEDPGTLYVIATNTTGTVASPSIEYLQMERRPDLSRHDKKVAILTGVLKKAEFNPESSNVWVMRLYFDEGFIAYLYQDPGAQPKETPPK